MRIKKKYITMILTLILVMIFSLSGCGSSSNTPVPVEPDPIPGADRQSIVLGGVRSQSGPNAIFEQTAFGPQYKMWVDDLNANGGIYIPSLDKKLPVDLKIYDDKSDVPTMVRLYEQLCVEEKVDILLPPVGTTHLFAVAPIAQKYGYLMIAGEGGTKELEKYIEQDPNVFCVLNYSATQVPALVELFKEQEITSVFCAYSEDLYGTEYWNATQSALEANGVEISAALPIALTGGLDDEAIIKAAKGSKAQAFLTYCYREQGEALAKKAIELGYNPDLYLMGPGGSYDFLGDALFGDTGIDPNAGIEGLMGWGAWNEKSGERAREYSEHFKQYWIDKGEFWRNADGTPNPDGTVYQDWWGHICYYSVCQIYQQAIENAGEFRESGILDNAKLVDYVKTHEFDTVMNEHLKFTNNMLTADMYLGEIGQWQNGVFEVIDVSEHRTADPIVPKPKWPK
jgi:branched-chain amino acid transport system substrate-binding protein